MKKTTAILFLLILSFNIFGYRFVLQVLETKVDSHLESQIDNFRYDESQLVEIRVDLNMPYQERYTEFERQYGEIKIDGKPYTYVMRKIEGSVLVLKCIHNAFKEKIWNTSDEITKANSNQDHNSTPQKQNTSLLKLIKSDYFNNNDLTSQAIISDIINPQKIQTVQKLPEISILPLHQPPRC